VPLRSNFQRRDHAGGQVRRRALQRRLVIDDGDTAVAVFVPGVGEIAPAGAHIEVLDVVVDGQAEHLRAAAVQIDIAQLGKVAAAIGDEIEAAPVRRQPRFPDISV
jgi:hypothetical protein